MSQIEFKDVSKVYPNGHVGLKDINLNIEKVILQLLLDCLEQVNQLYYDRLIGYMIFPKVILLSKVSQ